jgi:hypothetical protein
VKFSRLSRGARRLREPELPPAIRQAWLGQHRLSVQRLCRRRLENAITRYDIAVLRIASASSP